MTSATLWIRWFAPISSSRRRRRRRSRSSLVPRDDRPTYGEADPRSPGPGATCCPTSAMTASRV